MTGAKIEPCLAAGNTCVIKPSSLNSGIGLKWAEILAKLDPPTDVIIQVTGY